MLIATAEFVDPALRELVHALHGHGLLADVQVLMVCGEPDVRLLACREAGDVSVELLASLADDPAPPDWHAVRVQGTERQVWRGPPRDAPAEDVVGFVEALLSGASGRHTYPRLG